MSAQYRVSCPCQMGWNPKMRIQGMVFESPSPGPSNREGIVRQVVS